MAAECTKKDPISFTSEYLDTRNPEKCFAQNLEIQATQQDVSLLITQKLTVQY
jgi:hypothetical protein